MHGRVMALIILWLLSATPALAQGYLDPGSGSMVVQAILGGVAGLAVLVKMNWHRIRGRFKHRGRSSGHG
jgi:hypothetical protein